MSVCEYDERRLNKQKYSGRETDRSKLFREGQSSTEEEKFTFTQKNEKKRKGGPRVTYNFIKTLSA